VLFETWASAFLGCVDATVAAAAVLGRFVEVFPDELLFGCRGCMVTEIFGLSRFPVFMVVLDELATLFSTPVTAIDTELFFEIDFKSGFSIAVEVSLSFFDGVGCVGAGGEYSSDSSVSWTVKGLGLLPGLSFTISPRNSFLMLLVVVDNGKEDAVEVSFFGCSADDSEKMSSICFPIPSLVFSFSLSPLIAANLKNNMNTIKNN
jgi:hypothetical protein